MKNLKAEFIKGAVKSDQFPDFKHTEAAFIGRSNVGKSSLLNSIVNRKNLAHISSTPGKTKEINFYLVEDKWSFADLPGFGYTSAGKAFKEAWAKLNLEYLKARSNLKLVCMLVDSRHEPMEIDLGIIEMLEEYKRKYIVILTKCDKISSQFVSERKMHYEYLLQKCNFAIEVLTYSSKTGLGRDQLLAVLKKNLN